MYEIVWRCPPSSHLRLVPPPCFRPISGATQQLCPIMALEESMEASHLLPLAGGWQGALNMSGGWQRTGEGEHCRLSPLPSPVRDGLTSSGHLPASAPSPEQCLSALAGSLLLKGANKGLIF